MKTIKIALLFLFSCLLIMIPTGCFKLDGGDTSIYTEQKYGMTQIVVMSMRDFKIVPIVPDLSYQWVKIESIEKIYAKYREDMFDKGVVRWDSRFDCNKFSISFAAFCQTKYFVETFGKKNHSQSIAIGEIYYRPDISRSDGGNYHAINIMIVNGEFRFFEPQTGEFVYLSQNERNNVIMIKF